MLVLALAVAAGFAGLGQWQLQRSIDSGVVVERETETMRPLTAVTEPQVPFSATIEGQLVSARGEFVEGDFLVLSSRVNGGVEGYWVVGHLRSGSGAEARSLAVGLGWAPTEEAAASVLDTLDGGPAVVTGRYMSGEAPQLTDFENGEFSVLSPAALINIWPEFAGEVYSGYVVSSESVPDLDLIDSPAPPEGVSLNWLNIFYAAEWVVFAGFALFMWYRLVRDAWEREVEEAAEAAAVPAAVPAALPVPADEADRARK